MAAKRQAKAKNAMILGAVFIVGISTACGSESTLPTVFAHAEQPQRAADPSKDVTPLDPPVAPSSQVAPTTAEPALSASTPATPVAATSSSKPAARKR